MAGKPGHRRTVEQMEKDAKALTLHCQGRSYQQIADELGWRGKGAAFGAVKRAIADRQKDAFGQTEDFALAVARVQRAIAYHENVMATAHYAVSTTGKLVLGPDEKPVLDPGPGQRSAVELRHLYDQLNKLQGTYAPTKSRQEVVTEDVVDAEIAKLAKELAEAGNQSQVKPELPR